MKNAEVQQNQIDRFNMLQREYDYTIEGNVVREFLDCGIVVKPDLITRCGLDGLTEEFHSIWLNHDGLVLSD